MSTTSRTDAQHFAEQIDALTSALGDSTRRGIYVAARESAEPLTASQVAELFDIHPNVARHHLDHLVKDGYLEVTRRRPSGRNGPGAGRPAKCYTVTDKAIDLHFPERHPGLLVQLLLDVIDDLGGDTVADVARQVGRRHGERLAAEVGVPDQDGYEVAVSAVAKAMTGVGFTMSADTDLGRLITSCCPFGDQAIAHPHVVCSLDQGLVEGLLGKAEGCGLPTVKPHAALDEACVTEVSIAPRSA